MLFCTYIIFILMTIVSRKTYTVVHRYFLIACWFYTVYVIYKNVILMTIVSRER